MRRDVLIIKRAGYQVLLDKIDTGKIVHLDGDETGQLRVDTTAEQRASLVQRIAELDQRIAEAPHA